MAEQRHGIAVDAHQHFWDLERFEFPWMTQEALRRRFGPGDLRPQLQEHGVDRTVVVQALSSLDETRYLLELAAGCEFVAGVVGWVDLTDPRVGDTLAELRARPDGAYLVGVRHQIHDERDPEWASRDDVRRGLRAVQEAELAFDLLVRTRELPAALRVVRDLPALRFVIDHLAKPPIAGGGIDEWAGNMAPFAELPNVWCKLSGLVTEADPERWTPDDFVPYVHRALEWFGEDRLLFGSDWPVCLLAASYEQVIEVAEHALGRLSQAARAKVFGANAAELYRLGWF